MNQHPHTCVYFDDGDDVEQVCVCGSRALLVLEEDGTAVLLGLLEEDEVVEYAATA